MIHGGDIYQQHIDLDFSVNIDPYGPLPQVLAAMREAVGHVSEYPEYGAGRLTAALAELLELPQEKIVMTAGASEGFLACAHALRPGTGLVLAPSFYGYEYALSSVGAQIRREKDLLRAERADMVFAGNPNNPTSLLTPPDAMRSLVKKCAEEGTALVVDECFLMLAGAEEESLIREVRERPEDCGQLVIARSFTKTFAIPGVRLGYLVCADEEIADRIRKNLPEWNISGIAQEAGLAALACLEEMKEHIRLTLEERERFDQALGSAGLKTVPGRANYILAQGPEDLKTRLLERNVLIRDCGNFYGLDAEPGMRWFRFAVRRPEENARLIGVLRGLSGNKS